MDILLWRHAEAEDGPDDMNRALTKKGREQARVMAEWIREHGPKELRVWVSPARRTRETAEPFGAAPLCVDMIGPGATCADALEVIEKDISHAAPTRRTPLLLVGHQPTLGQVAACLMTGSPAPWVVKKGAMWWITCPDNEPLWGNCSLKVALQPKFLAAWPKIVP